MKKATTLPEGSRQLWDLSARWAALKSSATCIFFLFFLFEGFCCHRQRAYPQPPRIEIKRRGKIFNRRFPENTMGKESKGALGAGRAGRRAARRRHCGCVGGRGPGAARAGAARLFTLPPAAPAVTGVAQRRKIGFILKRKFNLI